MTHPLSLLQRALPSDVLREPFPCLVIENALPAALYEELADSFPSRATMGISEARNNLRWNYAARKVLANKSLPELWRNFIAYNSSAQFFSDVVALFHSPITELYGDRFPDRSSLEALRVGMRDVDKFGRCDVLVEAMISGNTPVTTASSVRTSHVDAGNKLFSGLFYMRSPEDVSSGGDLTISRFAERYRGKEDRFKLFNGPYVDDTHLEVARTVPYAANTLVLFINSLDSLHGVTIRRETPHPRLFVNLVGEVDDRLYRLYETDSPKAPHYVPNTLPRQIRRKLVNLGRSLAA
jgi:hypothetical protein